MSRKKQRAWSKAKTINSDQSWSEYKALKKETRNENRKAYQAYMKSLLDEDMSNKKLWKLIKTRRHDPVGVSPLLNNDLIHSCDKDKAEILNDQFCSVFVTNETPPNPNSAKPILQFNKTMPCISINENGIEKLLHGLQANKASGPDGIPPRLLKLVAPEISPALAKLFEASLSSGKIPSAWKHAIVQPVFKKGDRSQPGNYRPISLTCICCKVLEHIVRTAITDHLEANNILTNSQYGFRKNRSCETQLIQATDEFTAELDKGGQTDVILLDFAKAFDKVPHQRLLLKLELIGIDEKTVKWIKSFLQDRTQEVVVGDERSKIGKVTSGVPQGSVLGPTLFLVYINDLPDNLKSNVYLFADDTLISKKITSTADCNILNEDLRLLQNWESKWLMSFNVSKCNVLSITNKRDPITFDYQLHDQTLQRVKSAKYLGVELTEHMKWDKHVRNITSKANKTSAFINRNLKGSSIGTQLACFKSLARPILEYASTVWDPHYKKDIDALENIQKRAARRITNDFSRHSSATNLVRNLGLDTLEKRRRCDKAVMFHKIYHQKTCIRIPNYITPKKRKTRGHENQLIQPQTKTDTYRHSFFPSAIKLWNNLPDDVAETENENRFKSVIGFCL